MIWHLGVHLIRLAVRALHQGVHAPVVGANDCHANQDYGRADCSGAESLSPSLRRVPTTSPAAAPALGSPSPARGPLFLAGEVLLVEHRTSSLYRRGIPVPFHMPLDVEASHQGEAFTAGLGAVSGLGSACHVCDATPLDGHGVAAPGVFRNELTCLRSAQALRRVTPPLPDALNCVRSSRAPSISAGSRFSQLCLLRSRR